MHDSLVGQRPARRKVCLSTRLAFKSGPLYMSLGTTSTYVTTVASQEQKTVRSTLAIHCTGRYNLLQCQVDTCHLTAWSIPLLWLPRWLILLPAHGNCSHSSYLKQFSYHKTCFALISPNVCAVKADVPNILCFNGTLWKDLVHPMALQVSLSPAVFINCFFPCLSFLPARTAAPLSVIA